MKHAVKAIAVALTAVILFISTPITSQANGGGSKKVASVTDEQLNVQYKGTADNHIAFRVEFENPKADKFWLIIKNDNGDVIWHHQYSDTHFSKDVFFENTDAEIHPTFVIRASDNTEIVRQFQVAKTLTENTVV